MLPTCNNQKNSCCQHATPILYDKVISVNGKSGVVTLNAYDINAVPKPAEEINNTYLKYQDGNYILSSVKAECDVDFNDELHLMSL